MDSKYKLIADSFGNDSIKLDEPLKDRTALGIGGSAKVFFVATSKPQIIKMVKTTKALKLPCLIFGTGSKLIVSDKGFDGVIIKNRTNNIAVLSVKGKVGKSGIEMDEAMVEVDSGVTLKNLIEFLDKQSLESADIQDLPGSLGGNIFLNKVLQDKSEVIQVLEDGEVEQIKKNALSLRKHIVLSVVFRFKAKR